MTVGKHFARMGRGLAIGTAVLAAVGLTVPRPAHAVDAGAAVGIGLGALALGAALGSTANPNNNNPNYYSNGSYPNGYYPNGYYPNGYYPNAYATAPAYSPTPAPAYSYYPTRPNYQQRNCWDPYYRRYYAC
jgi:hypothetical protein